MSRGAAFPGHTASVVVTNRILNSLPDSPAKNPTHRFSLLADGGFSFDLSITKEKNLIVKPAQHLSEPQESRILIAAAF